jgi:hypothetical protein
MSELDPVSTTLDGAVVVGSDRSEQPTPEPRQQSEHHRFQLSAGIGRLATNQLRLKR